MIRRRVEKRAQPVAGDSSPGDGPKPTMTMAMTALERNQKDELEQVNALYSLLEDRYWKKVRKVIRPPFWSTIPCPQNGSYINNLVGWLVGLVSIDGRFPSSSFESRSLHRSLGRAGSRSSTELACVETQQMEGIPPIYLMYQSSFTSLFLLKLRNSR